MKKILTIIIAIIISVTLFSCSQVEQNDVYVTVYPMQFITEEIFEGTEYTVGIVPGVTSHETSIDWSPKEIIAMTEATYLFYVGAKYDQYIDLQIESIFTDRDVQLVKIEDESSYIEFIPGVIHSHECDDHDDHENDHGSLGIDPHFWVSPLKVQQVATLIYEKLIIEFDDPNGVMQTNYLSLIADLQELSDDYELVITNATKAAMVSTNIYGYLRSDYGFDYISISPGYHEEPEQLDTSAKEEIVTDAVKHNIQYIIYEKYTSSPLSNSVFDELNALELNPIKVEFNILQALSNDEIDLGHNYINVMYENLELLKLALGYQSE